MTMRVFWISFFSITSFLLGILSFHRSILTHMDVGFYWKGVPPVVVQVEPGSPAEEAGIRPGDILLGVDGREVPVSHLASALHQEKALTLTMQRGNHPITLTFTPPRKATTLPFLLKTFAGLFCLACGTLVLFRRKDRVSWIFLLLMVLTFNLLALVPAGKINDLRRTLALFHDLSLWLFPVALLHFVLLFPAPLFAKVKYFAWTYLAPLSLFLLNVDATFWKFLRIPYPLLADLTGYYRLLMGVLFITAWGVFFFRRFTAPSASQKAQFHWIFVGLLMGFLPYLALVNLAGGGERGDLTLFVFAFLFLPVLPVGATYALLAYRLGDVSDFLRHIIAYFLTLSCALAVFLLFQRLIPFQPTFPHILSLFVLAIFLVFLSFPLHQWLENALQKIQYGKTYPLRQDLEAFAQTLPSFSSLDTLFSAFKNRVERALEVKVNLYIMKKNQAYKVFEDDSLPPVLNEEEMLLVELPFPYFHRFPLFFQEKLLGMLVLTGKGDTHLSHETLHLINTLTGPLAMMIHNLKLINHLQETVDHLTYWKRFHEALFDESPVGIVVLDEGGRILQKNRPAEAILGLESQTWQDAFGQPFPKGEGHYLWEASGRTFFCAVKPLDWEGKPQWVISLLEAPSPLDLPDKISQQEKLIHLGQLSASIAHEINTPLTAISSYTQMLQKDLEEAKKKRYLAYIEYQAHRLSRLVRTLLHLVREEATQRERCDLGNLLENCFATLYPIFEAHNFFPEKEKIGENFSLLGNPLLLEQALANLILNACEAVQWKGEVKVTLVNAGASYAISVKDNGPGVSEKVLKELGKPLTSSQHPGGTGLGLALVRLILFRHGGTVEARRLPEGGSCFTMKLPKL